MEYPAEFEPIETNSAPAFPFGNSTFKRAWISRLMYQKTFRGQLAVDLLAVARHGRRALYAQSGEPTPGGGGLTHHKPLRGLTLPNEV